MGAPHVLSISPILVIDDNHFQEILYKELWCNATTNDAGEWDANAKEKKNQSYSTKLSETSPPLALIAKMGEKLRGPI